MIGRLVIGFLLLLPLVITGCSSGNSSDGTDHPDNQAHPSNWITAHPQYATASADYADCVGCHGADLTGIGEAVSCFSCHVFNAAPPVTIHPSYWVNVYLNHRGYAAAFGTATCTRCHGSDLHGSVAAPSCFLSSSDGRSCHAAGPGQIPHPVDTTYLDGTVHGPDAAVDLTVCQVCHGEPGGPGTNPRFNVGIDSRGGTGCEACHGINLAHPAQWAGEAGLYHDLAGNTANACTLCHGVALDGVGGVPGAANCFDCHGVAPTGANEIGCISCHNEPPDGQPPVGNLSPNRAGQHAHVAYTRPGEECNRCHNGAGFRTPNHFDSTNPADVNLIHPDGTDTISNVTDATNTTCNGNCHVITDTVDFYWTHNNETWY